MKTKVYKARHYWKDGGGTWERSGNFDDKVFGEFQEQYSKLRSEHKEYILISGKPLFLFYEMKKENKGRGRTEISALLLNKNVNDPSSAFKDIKKQIKNPCDNALEYEIEISNERIRNQIKNSFDEKNMNWKVSLALFVFVVSTIIFTLYPHKYSDNTGTNKADDDNTTVVTTPEPASPLGGDINTTKKDQPQPPMPPNVVIKTPVDWEWADFCKNNSIKEPGQCYQGFIEAKCNKKADFSQSYTKYAAQKENEGLCIDTNKIKHPSDDPNLKDHGFGQKDMKFFEGD